MFIYIAIVISLGCYTIYSGQRVKKMRTELKRLNNENNLLAKKLKVKHMYVQSAFQRVVRKNEFLTELKRLITASKSRQITQLIDKIEHMLNEEAAWNRFVRDFEFFHSDLFAKLNLDQKLTKTDIKLLGLIYFNLTNKEIAFLLNQSTDGVKKGRFRLRKKLNLETTDSLEEALH